MIITAFINILVYLMETAISLFPFGEGLPVEVHESATYIGSYAKTFDAILPINTLFTVLTILITVELIILTFKSFKWLISHIPFIGGRG